MEVFLFVLSILVLSSSVISLSIVAPEMQRKNPGENCKLQWKVTGTFTNYTITFLGNSNPVSLGSHTNTAYDRVNNIITLTIWNVQTSDGGYYVLSVAADSQSPVDSNGILFVYGSPNVVVRLSSGRNPASPGDVFVVDCTATSNSVPSSFSTKFYYYWSSNWAGSNYNYFPLQNTSSGPAYNGNGDIVPGFTLRNNGQTLVVNTAEILSLSSISLYCQALEDGWIYRSYYNGITVSVPTPPVAYNFNPRSMRYIFPAAGNTYVYVSFYHQSYNSLTSYTNWSFVDSAGNLQEYAVSQNPNISSVVSFGVYLPTTGNLSMTLFNYNGSTTVTFQITTAGIPETPMNFKVQYVTHGAVSLQWLCGWYNGNEQTVTLSLQNIANKAEIGFQRFRITSTTCYNDRYFTLFQNNLEPETDYKASIWSTNKYGSSKVSQLTVTTLKKPDFSVSCDSISVSDTQAVIRVNTSLANIWLSVTCCVEKTNDCILRSYNLLTTQNQIVYDLISPDSDLVCDFVFFNVTFYNMMYNISAVKGIKVSRRTSECDAPVMCKNDSGTCKSSNSNPDESNPQLSIIVIILATLLGVVIIVLVVSWIVCLRWRRQLQSKPNNSIHNERPKSIFPTSSLAGSRESQVSETYEEVGMERHYTPLHYGRPKPSKT